MENNKLLFYNFEEAAIHLTKCFESPMKWWLNEKVQLTRKKINEAFCQSFNPYEFAKNI
jgi:hypothetical protein